MIDPPELIGLIDNSRGRRLWLLFNAMQHLPFPQAIECARSAECFLTGSFPDAQLGDAHLDTASDAEASAVCDQSEQLATETSSDASVEHPTTAKPVRLAVSAEHRERLLDRLAPGREERRGCGGIRHVLAAGTGPANGLRSRNRSAPRSARQWVGARAHFSRDIGGRDCPLFAAAG